MFSRGLVVGIAVGVSSCVAGYKLLITQIDNIRINDQEPHLNKTAASILKYGTPTQSPSISIYANHILHYDQERKIPRWVAERLTYQHIHGSANRRQSQFQPDPSVPSLFTAQNKDYWNSGWSRGHMAPAGDNKYDQNAMNDTFLLTNVVPQDIDNNAGFWNRLEMYCRDLTKKFDEVYVISGPLFLPCATTTTDGKTKKFVKYEVIGNSDVAVPSHLFKVIIAVRGANQEEVQYIGAFVVANEPISKEHDLREYQVSLEYIESKTGYTLLPLLDRSRTKNLCEEEGCRLITWEKFEMYFIGRKIEAATTLRRLEKVWQELEKKKLTPDSTLTAAYHAKRVELETLEAMTSVKDS